MSKRKKKKTEEEVVSIEEVAAEIMIAESESEVDADVDAEELESEPVMEGEGSEEQEELRVEEDALNPFDQMLAESGASDEDSESSSDEAAALDGSELDSFESAEIEDVEFVEEERLDSILESMLFASDRPISLATFKMTFKGTNVRTEHLRRALDRLAMEYAGGRRGVSLDEVPGGFQIRTKLDNMKFLTRTLKVRPFKLSGAALEVLAIVAYKQPTIKSEIDEIRGVESGHLLRALMEKGLVQFEGKSDFPGRPMLYGTTKKFLEIFGLRNLKELPTLSQIDELLPEGIGDEQEAQKSKLGDLTDKLSQDVATSYSEGEEELNKITETLQDIDVSSEFFEKEKLRQKESRDAEKATSLRESLMLGESLSNRDKSWLERYDAAIAQGTTLAQMALAKEKANLERMKSGGASTAEAGAEEVQDGDVVAEESSVSVAGELSALSFEEEAAAPRFEEEEDISLDQDLNVPFHDDEEAEA